MNNIKFLMSNSNTSFVIDIFKKYKSEIITARRAINSKNPASTTTELLIFNY